MSIYKQASQLKLRITTSVGNLSVEQLWDLGLEELDELAVKLERKYKSTGKKSFLDKKTEENEMDKLKFDLVYDILDTKVKAANAASEEAEIKRHNQKIDELIAQKQNEELAGKSIEELEELRK